MVIFDANIFIYIAKEQIKLSEIESLEIAYASITVIETLGFQQIGAAEQFQLKKILESYQQLELSEPIIDRAVVLRQARKMSLGDAIVVATALEYGHELWTANTKDFEHINDLKIYNPLKS